MSDDPTRVPWFVEAARDLRAAERGPGTEQRWEMWARHIAPLIHDGLLDVPGERQIIDKAFAAARLLDDHLPAGVATAAVPLDALARLHRMMGYAGEGTPVWRHLPNPDGLPGQQQERFLTFRVEDVHATIDKWAARLSADEEGTE